MIIADYQVPANQVDWSAADQQVEKVRWLVRDNSIPC